MTKVTNQQVIAILSKVVPNFQYTMESNTSYVVYYYDTSKANRKGPKVSTIVFDKVVYTGTHVTDDFDTLPDFVLENTKGE